MKVFKSRSHQWERWYDLHQFFQSLLRRGISQMDQWLQWWQLWDATHFILYTFFVGACWPINLPNGCYNWMVLLNGKFLPACWYCIAQSCPLLNKKSVLRDQLSSNCFNHSLKGTWVCGCILTFWTIQSNNLSWFDSAHGWIFWSSSIGPFLTQEQDRVHRQLYECVFFHSLLLSSLQLG